MPSWYSGNGEDYDFKNTSGYAVWFTVGGAIRIAHYDVIDDVIIWVQDENSKKNGSREF